MLRYLRGQFAFLTLFLMGFACYGASRIEDDAKQDEKTTTSAADEDAASDDQKSDVPAAEPPEKKDRYAVPEGGVDELLAFIKEIEAFRPRNVNDYVAHRDKSPAALQAAAKAILETESDETSEAHRTASFILLKVKAGGISRMKPAQQREMLKELFEAFASRDLGSQELSLAMSVARSLEYSSGPEMAVEAYEGFARAFGKSDNPQVASYADMLLGSARRLQLVGNAMELAGTKMDGTAFALGELKGKVVLIDFWATWCGPCRAEHPNIKKNYDRYHDHGFAVVGVSLDQNREALEKYLEDEHVPWTTLHEADKGGKHPATAYYGITGIPTMILVGRDGKVLSTSARGSELNRLLAEQFPDVPEIDKTDAEPADDAATDAASG